MLNTRFPRFPGDIGNPDTFSVATSYRMVNSAKTTAIVTSSGIDPAVADDLLDAAVNLAREPVDLIVTSCGFLSELQTRIQQQAGVPVISSSLVLLPVLRALHGPAASIAIMTFDSTRLSTQHFENYLPVEELGGTTGDKTASGKYTIVGMQNSAAFFTMISNDLADANFDELQNEVRDVARQLIPDRPDAIVLECTNLSPYKAALRQLLGVPVYDLVDAAEWLVRC